MDDSCSMRPVLVGLGFSAIIAQLTLVRELLCVYAGNELVIGVILGNWLLLTGLGAWGGRMASGMKRWATVLAIGLLLLAVLPIGTLAAVRTLRHFVFLRGSAIDPTQTVLSSFIVLMPYCVLSGWLLSACCALMSRATNDARGLGTGYAWDCGGGLLGGVLFSFILAPHCDHFTMLSVPAIVLATLVAWRALRDRRNLLFAAAVFLLGSLAAVVFMVDLDAVTTAREFPGQQVVFRGHSPYGRLVVTERAGQRDFIQNGVPIFAIGDPFAKKETAHLAMLQRPNAKRVLLLGGGVAGTAAEILKHPVERLDYVELDPLLIKAVRATEKTPDNEHAGALNDSRLRIYGTDARQFIRRTDAKYDVIIVDLPDPSTAQLNRFHTSDFFSQVKRVLVPEGVLSIGLSHYENRMTPELEPLIAIPAATLRDNFENILALPGGFRIHFLASDGPLTSNLEARAKARPALAFYPEYLQSWLTLERLEDLRLAAEVPAQVNTDLSPRLYFHRLVQTFSQYRTRYSVFIVVLALLLVAFVVRARAAQLGLMAVGFSASALNMVVLLAFQTIHGALYQDLGWLTAAFMLGLALGAAWAGGKVLRSALQAESTNKRSSAIPRITYLSVMLALTVLSALLPLLLWLLGRLYHPFGASMSAHVFFPLLLLLVACLVGAAFPLAGQVDFDDSAATTSRAFFADYIGAFFGALLVSTLLIPLMGVVTTCLITAGLNLLAAGVIWVRRG